MKVATAKSDSMKKEANKFLYFYRFLATGKDMTGQEVVKQCNEKMGKAIEATKHKFTTIRAGRANVSMLDGIRVEQYGSEMPLNQVGSVSAPESRLLVIDPWDKSLISKIEKAIMAANLGLTPNNDGKVIRLVTVSYTHLTLPTILRV